MADIAELIVALRLQDGVSSGLGNLNRQLSGMQGGLSQVSRGVGQVGRGLDTLATRGAIAAAAGLGAVVTAAVSFEDAFAGVRKTVDASEDDLQGFEDQLREMARTIPVSFQELAGIAEQGGALGIAFDGLDEFTRVVADLAATTDLSADAAATSLGVLGNVLGISAEDFDNFGSALVDLGNKGASTESQILGIAERAGAAGDLIGLSADQVLGFGSAAANLGIDIEAGGSALQRFFIDSLTAVEEGGEGLQTFARVAGQSADDFQTAFREDAGAALTDFIRGLGELPEAVQIQTLQDLGFDDVRITRLLLGLAGDVDNLRDSLTISAEAFAENSALGEEAAKRYETTASQLKILKQNLTDAAVTIGDELLPIVNDLTKEFVAFINTPEVREGIKAFAVDLAQGIRDFADEVRRGDFNQLIDVLKGAAGIAKAGFDAFRALPPGVQSLALAAFGINKLTGGALSGIAGGLGNIISGGIKILFERGATPANPLWVQMVGGPLGGGTGGTGPGGLAVGAATTVGAAAVATGGILAIEDIASGTEEGIIRGILSQGVPGLIGRAVGEAVQPLIDTLLNDSPLFDPDADLWNPQFPDLPPSDLLRDRQAINVTEEMRDQFRRIEQEGVKAVLPDTAMQPVVTAINEVRDAIKLSTPGGGKTFGGEGRKAGGFVSDVKLDPSQVIDLRRPTALAADHLQRFRVEYGVGVSTQVSQLAQSRADTSSRLSSLAGLQATTNSRLSTANVHLGNVASKNFAPSVKTDVYVTNNLSVNEWQRTVYSSVRATTPTSPTLL